MGPLRRPGGPGLRARLSAAVVGMVLPLVAVCGLTLQAVEELSQETARAVDLLDAHSRLARVDERVQAFALRVQDGGEPTSLEGLQLRTEGFAISLELRELDVLDADEVDFAAAGDPSSSAGWEPVLDAARDLLDDTLDDLEEEQRSSLVRIEEARAEVRRLLPLACLGALALAGAVARSFSRSVLRPVSALREASDALPEGRLGHRIGAAGGDELARLSDDFDQMAEALESTTQALERRASHDVLTGLLNRHGLAELVAERGPSVRAVLVLDLDDFKTVNDSMGHEVGDAVLVAAARRLERAAGESGARVARLGGDEFAVVVLADDRLGEDDVLEVAARLRRALDADVDVDGRSVRTGCSVGCTLRHPDEDRPVEHDVLLREADLALYAAKGAGGARAQLFVEEMRREAEARLGLVEDLRRGLRDGELVTWYQLVVDLATEQPVGAEALVRWQHPRRGLVPPADFVPAAEDSGLVVELGAQVLEQAVTEAVRWRDLCGGAGLPVSVNVSARQLEHDGFVDQVAAVLDRHRLPAGLLVLEVTESSVMRDPEAVQVRLERLAALGVALAVDDFGTGYASLAYLQRLPFGVLKVDKTFVDPLGDAEAGRDAAVLAAALVGLAEDLHLTSVGEGVETRAQAEHLRALGCVRGQGYLWHRPSPAEQVRELLGAAGGAPPPVWVPDPRAAPDRPVARGAFSAGPRGGRAGTGSR